MIVDCAYRVAPKCSVAMGKYDTDKGVIVEHPELMQFKVPERYPFFRDNYASGFMEDSVLTRAMCLYPTALLAINYNNVAAFLVFEKDCMMYLVASGKTTNYDIPEKKIKVLQSRVIGVCKMPVISFEVFQPMMYLAATVRNGQECVYLPDGSMHWLPEKFDDISGKPDLSRYIEMCETERAVGTCSVEGSQFVLMRYGQELYVK